MANGVDVGPSPVDQQVHAEFRGRIPTPAQLPAIEVRDDHIIGRHHTFADARGRGENPPRVEPQRNISVGRGHIAPLMNPAPRCANVTAVLVFRFQRSRRN